MRFVIPLPPSKNDSHDLYAVAKKEPLLKAVAWLGKGGGKPAWDAVIGSLRVVRKRSDAYDRFLEELDAMLIGQNVSVLEGDIRLSVTAFFPDRRRDMANIVDVLLDCLEGRAYGNDRQVVEFGRWSREVDEHDPRCVVTVEPFNLDLFHVEPDDAQDPADMKLTEEF